MRTTPEEMITFWKMTTVGAILLGTTGFNGHFANGLAALYIACGQDAACVVESAVGITRMEVKHGGDLYVSVSLPNLMVGTVGGGTGLPSRKLVSIYSTFPVKIIQWPLQKWLLRSF